MWNSRDHVSCTQHLEVTHTFQKSKFENLNDAWLYNIDAHVTLQLGNKVKMEQIIMFTRNRELAFRKQGMFFVGWFQSSERIFSRKQKFRFPLLSDAYIIITSMPTFATYRVKVEWIISETLTAVLRESRVWKLCTFQVQERFSNFLLVTEICLAIPIRTACCERMCDFRSTLSVSTVEALMRLSINGVVSPDHYHWWTGWK